MLFKCLGMPFRIADQRIIGIEQGDGPLIIIIDVCNGFDTHLLAPQDRLEPMLFIKQNGLNIIPGYPSHEVLFMDNRTDKRGIYSFPPRHIRMIPVRIALRIHLPSPRINENTMLFSKYLLELTRDVGCAAFKPNRYDSYIHFIPSFITRRHSPSCRLFIQKKSLYRIFSNFADSRISSMEVTAVVITTAQTAPIDPNSRIRKNRRIATTTKLIIRLYKIFTGRPTDAIRFIDTSFAPLNNSVSNMTRNIGTAGMNSAPYNIRMIHPAAISRTKIMTQLNIKKKDAANFVCCLFSSSEQPVSFAYNKGPIALLINVAIMQMEMHLEK